MDNEGTNLQHKTHRIAEKNMRSAIVINFGTRAVSDQNFSKMIALPKQALANLGSKVERVKVELVQEGNSKYIKLTPASEGGEQA
jgi:hypothetical protein